MRTEGPVARCDDVVKVFHTASGRVHALRGVTAVFPRGGIAAVVGPSGSGKSSLLRLLAGMDVPTSGSVVVEGRPLERASARARRRLRRGDVGYVFQRPSDNLVPHLTVAEHVARVAGWNDVAQILDALGIGDRADHLPVQLSGGEQQRAAFAQALAGGAGVVISDEPTAELDDVSGRAVLAAIRAMGQRGVTFILATHDPAVAQIADLTIRLEHGEVADPRRPASQAMSVVSPTHAPPDGDARVRLRDVVKTYRRADEVVHAVDGVSFDVSGGELVGLVGRSGSGKTTLLSIVAAWELPDGGSVERVRVRTDGPPRWQEIAIVPQNLGLMDELTIRENVAYPATLEGSAGGYAERVDGLLDALGLSALAHRRPSETSVGEQQRAAVARALLLRPSILVADEPTCHQDRGWTERVLTAIRETCDTGTACIMATHDASARPYLDRTLEMHDGRIAATTA